MATPAAIAPKRSPSYWLLLLLVPMVALGIWSSRPPAPREVDDPQPLFQLYRQGVPRDLLTALPLQTTDEFRVAAEAPMALRTALFFGGPDGKWRELQPVERRQAGKLLQLTFPELGPTPVGGPPGLRLALAVSSEAAPASLQDVERCFGTEAWPNLPRYALIYFTPKRIEVTGPKGPKLPTQEATQAVEDRLKAAAAKLHERFPFFVGVAVPCESPHAADR